MSAQSWFPGTFSECLHRLPDYTDDRSLDACMAPYNHDVVMVPRGYHPVAAIAGYDSYYLNVMAGPDRKWLFTTALSSVKKEIFSRVTLRSTGADAAKPAQPALPSNVELNNGAQRIKLKMDNWIVK